MTPVPNTAHKHHSVNRLILIGNGFDLSHGLRSSFSDFVNVYVGYVLKSFYKNGTYKDILIELKFIKRESSIIIPGRKIFQGTSAEELISLSNSQEVSVIYHSTLFKTIINEVQYKNWVDIEVQYFDVLANIFDGKYTISDTLETQLKKLNLEIDFLRGGLINYLENELDNLSLQPVNNLIKQFCSKILPKECLLNSVKSETSPGSLYFLNFNYTSIVQIYSERIKSIPSTINYIHGCIHSSLSNGQEPIFGFGDELDKRYKTFEDGRSDEPFKHIKSFKYLESTNYRNLLEFVESNPFQVHIYGHSCGISDRTMLNEIFEHKNCISVKAYYHKRSDGSDDFTEKNYAISRHFTDKAMLRSKVVNRDFCEPMFQPLGESSEKQNNPFI